MSDRKSGGSCSARRDHRKAFTPSTRSFAALSTLLVHTTEGACILTLVDRVFTSRYEYILRSALFPSFVPIERWRFLHVSLLREVFRPHARFVDTIMRRVHFCFVERRYQCIVNPLSESLYLVQKGGGSTLFFQSPLLIFSFSRKWRSPPPASSLLKGLYALCSILPSKLTGARSRV